MLVVSIFASTVAGCQPAKPNKDALGDTTIMLSFRKHGTWGEPITVRAFPDEYLVLEHQRCRREDTADATRSGLPGYCVFKIDDSQTNALEKAMEPFRKYAVPLGSFSMANPPATPDGKPCPKAFDFPLYSLTWTTTRGTRIATFDSGCRAKENPQFYRNLDAITDTLPLKEILASD